MAEQQVDEKLQRADRFSKYAALFGTLALFGVATQLTDNATFNASIAAFAGVGVRLYIPYHASISAGALPSQAHPMTGDYHHGAVGGGLVVGSIAALGVMVVEPNIWIALGAGLGVSVLSYLVLRTALPS